MNKICKTCNHWESKHIQEYLKDHYEFGADKDIVVSNCTNKAFHIGYNLPEIWESNRVLVEGDEGWGFLTGPDFGCIHWEPINEGGNA